MSSKKQVSHNDIRKQSFKNATFGGYRKEDVSQYLADVADSWQELRLKNEQLQKEVNYLHSDLRTLKENEQTLIESLSEAQEAGRMTKERAQKQADLKILEGKMQADALLQHAKSQAKQILLNTQHLADQTLTEMKREIKLLHYAYQYSSQQKNQMIEELKGFLHTALTKIERLSALDVEHPSEQALERAERLHQRHSHVISSYIKNIDKDGDLSNLPQVEPDFEPEALQKSAPKEFVQTPPVTKTFQQKEPKDFFEPTQKRENPPVKKEPIKPSSRGLIFDLNNL